MDAKPCKRRLAYGDRLVCAPDHAQLATMTPREVLASPRLYKPCDITLNDCVGCPMFIEGHPEPTPTTPQADVSLIQFREGPQVPKKRKPTPPEFLRDGTIKYTVTSGEPPPVPRGYKRKGKSPPDSWVFVPASPLCKYLSFEEYTTNCNSCKHTKLKAVCLLDGRKIACDSCPRHVTIA